MVSKVFVKVLRRIQYGLSRFRAEGMGYRLVGGAPSVETPVQMFFKACAGSWVKG